MSSEKGVGPGRETELSPFGGGTEEPDVLQSVGSQRVGHNLATEQQYF